MPLLLPLLRATQAARTCQNPPAQANRSCWREAASHWSRGSGNGRCPVTWTSHMRSTHSTCCHAEVQLLTELHSKHADLYSQARFRRPITKAAQRAPVISKRDGANVAIDIIYINKTESPLVTILTGRQVENQFCTVLYRFLHLLSQ